MSRRKQRRYGQNFLTDSRIVSRIVRRLDTEPARVLEIGPGRGALTGALLRAFPRVRALELDEQLVPRLHERFAGSHLELENADALTVDLDEACDRQAPWQVVGNLPYSVGTAILRRLLPRHDLFSRLIVMLQREVAHRIVARPGDREHGLIALERAAWADGQIAFDVPPKAFRPRPKVVSTVLVFTPRPPQLPADRIEAALRIAAHALLHPRKTLGNAARPLLSPDQLVAADLDPSVRPCELSLEQWAQLSTVLDGTRNA